MIVLIGTERGEERRSYRQFRHGHNGHREIYSHGEANQQAEAEYEHLHMALTKTLSCNWVR